MSTLILALTGLLALDVSTMTQLPTTAPGSEAARASAETLVTGLSNMPTESAAALEHARAVATAARKLLGETSLNAARIAAAVDVAPSEMMDRSSQAMKRVVRDLERIAADLAFTPKSEAPRPAGFPAATPVGEIAVLDYPVYRMARVPMSGRGSNGAFWKLFGHIESNKIAMTAPVEIAYDEKGTNARAGSMAFLYVSRDIGQLGVAGEVEVLDVPAARVVSIGLRGSPNETRIASAVEELRGWLEGHPLFEAVGTPRTMGWNSPMVAESKRFTEVQIVVRNRVVAETKNP